MTVPHKPNHRRNYLPPKAQAQGLTLREALEQEFDVNLSETPEARLERLREKYRHEEVGI